jgi:hypothetical protein
MGVTRDSAQQQVGQIRKMKILTILWDVVYGIILIGGGPSAVLFGPSVLLPQCMNNSVLVKYIVYASIILAIVTWVLATLHRACRRVSPAWLLYVEFILGTAVGVAFFVLVGVMNMAAYG